VGIIIRDALLKVFGQNLPGTEAEFGQKLTVIHEKNPQTFWDTEDPLPVRYLPEDFFIKPFTKFNHPFLVAGGTEMTAFARERQ
jgi:hypothetical protein